MNLREAIIQQQNSLPFDEQRRRSNYCPLEEWQDTLHQQALDEFDAKQRDRQRDSYEEGEEEREEDEEEDSDKEEKGNNKRSKRCSR